MILKTGNSVYEVDTEAKRFRLIDTAHSRARATAGWQRFDYMTPPKPGERVRFSWIAGERGRAARIKFVDTSPVKAVSR